MPDEEDDEHGIRPLRRFGDGQRHRAGVGRVEYGAQPVGPYAASFEKGRP